MKDQRSRAPASVDNIYRLDGRVPVGKAIPFGLQHVLAMFVANVTPVMLIASVAVYNGQAFTAIDTALLIQAAMLIAGIGTLIQLYPVWRIGSRLPVVMGLSFTFLSAMMTLAAKDYGLMIGAVIVGGCIEGLLGLTAKYWRRFVSPHRLGLRRDDDRLQPAVHGHFLVRQLRRLPHRRVAESAGRGHHSGGLPGL